MKEEVIERKLSCLYWLGEGSSDKQYSVDWKRIEKAHLVFYYHKNKDCYIVWNASLKKAISRKSDTANFEMGTEVKNTFTNPKIAEIKILKKKVSYKKKMDYYEKVVLVPKELLQEFCENYEAYIYPSFEEIKSKKFLLVEYLNEEVIIDNDEGKQYHLEKYRRYDSVLRARRDPEFRRKILEKYNNTCIVCGCKEGCILEAAHIKSVADGGIDSIENGLCLCRNHHKLYDSCLLTINLKEKKFSCSSEKEKKMCWYKKAAEKNFKLYLEEK